MTSADVRQSLIDALHLDLIGPPIGSPLVSEILPETPPSRWYLTGFLIPLDTPEEARAAADADDESDTADEERGADDAAAPEKASGRRGHFPSSIGLSFLIPKEASGVRVTARWGDYQPIATEGAEKLPTGEAAPQSWQRTERFEEVSIDLKKSGAKAVPHSNGLRLEWLVKPIKDSPLYKDLLPKGSRAVSIFLINERTVQPDPMRDRATIFQASLIVQSEAAFTARPNLKGVQCDEWDEQVADLQFRDVYEYAVGHGVSARAEIIDGECRCIESVWIPQAAVERVAPEDLPGVEFGMETLATASNATELRSKLQPLVDLYQQWITKQKASVPKDTEQRHKIGKELLRLTERTAGRIDSGIQLLNDAKVFEAFRIANRAMATAYRRRQAASTGKKPAEIDAPKWRPFQLAFMLMNLRGIVEPEHTERETVDLLFFPTGGGKTEAYLGLAAFTLVYRRMKHPGIQSAGLSVLMRYTLRLLTLDQLGRAATLICALELEREKNVDILGDWPFEIGLWVGRAATPNAMGKKGDTNPESARTRTIAYKSQSRKDSPIPIEECPWCGQQFSIHSFNLVPNSDHPTDLRITCVNRDCEFNRNRRLPIVAVDEPIYRRLPCFLIATVDKFAAMPWVGEVGKFFGRAQRHDKNGFYGPCEPGLGSPIPGDGLPPPDLIIQDELHLISGPMGTMVGLYESALEALCSRKVGNKTIRPKIVASTATVRRAESQIRALFNHKQVDVFPPPGPNRRDSFFARTHAQSESQPRLYLGVVAPGRSPKVIMLRTYLALMGAAQKAYEQSGGKKNLNNPADPYMTMLGYFNSLRELGGCRRIIEDEITAQLEKRGQRQRFNEPEGLFANRTIKYEVVELTSRVSTNDVADAKRRLQQSFPNKEAVDVAIATNMISVGLDITRLGMMVVFGQPKTSAEYIQATSRVGRDHQRPGLVVTIMNIHRPRDRSHYERFPFYHQTFYRSVEATSVTPFSPRALDRGLAATLIALARQTDSKFTPPKGATNVLGNRGPLDWVVQALADRAEASADSHEAQRIRQRVLDTARDLLDKWEAIAKDLSVTDTRLQYQREEGEAPALLRDFLDPELRVLPQVYRRFRANRSMRDVEQAVNLWVKSLDNLPVEEDEQ